MARPTPKLYMNFGGSIRPKYTDVGAAAVWPLWDTYATEVEEIVADRIGTPTGISMGATGMIPEYGCASTFNGATSTFTIPHAAALAPTTTLTIAFLLKLGDATPANETIFRKENGGTGGRIVVGLKATGPKLYFGINVGSVYTELEYTIPTPADWVSIPRLIVARYDGANMQLIQILTTTGAVSTLATAAATGVVATGTGTAIYVGSNAASSEYFNGTLQWLGYWVNDYLTDAEITSIASSTFWTNVTADVMSVQGIDAQWGIAGGGPSDRLARTGTMQFDLNNGTTNSAGLVGYYSPNHANKRSGFDYSIPVQLALTDPAAPSTPYYKFVGRLVDITPEAGLFGDRVTHCQVVDYMDELARMVQPAIPIIRNDDSIEVVGRLLQYTTSKPHGVAVTSGGSEEFAYGIDTTQDETSKVMQEIQRAMDAEMGYLYVRGGQSGAGILTPVSRSVRQLETTADWTFTPSKIAADAGLIVTRRREEIINKVIVTVYPRTKDVAATTVLFSLDKPLFIGRGTSAAFRTPYTDPDSNSGRRVGGMDMVTPVSTTDYLGNSLEDGTGTNLTANVSPVVAFGANSAEVTITNTSSTTDLWVTFFRLRGRGVYTYQPVSMEATNEALRKKHGDNVLAVDQTYQDSPSDGKNAAQYLLNSWQNELTLARTLHIKPPDSDTALLTCAIAIDVGDLIAITEDVTGLDAKTYFVNGIRLKIHSNDIIETECILTPGNAIGAWAMGIAGRSEPGETAFLGY